MDENTFLRVKNYMKTKDYSFNESWLKECVQYCVETHPKLSLEDIQSFAIEQWLLSDLREINNKNGCLPKNLALQSCTTLNKSYILQIEKMYDISTSKYKQLEKIRKINVQNLKETEVEKSDTIEPKGKRMYQLFLTDGVQEIKAMEYKPIELFNKILLPGYKLKITGPVNCRRGIIMLEEKNIFGLGGEIEHLLIVNSIENVLARCLNLKENPDPYKDTTLKEESEKSDHDEEYLNYLEKLARSQESKESQRSNSNLNYSLTSNLLPGYELNLEEASKEQNSDEELEALLNDPDLVSEFSPIKSVRGNLFKVPIQPSIKMIQKLEDNLEKSRSISSRSIGNTQFANDGFCSENRNALDKKSFESNIQKSLLSNPSYLKAENSMAMEMNSGITKRSDLLKGWQIIPNEASMEISDTYQRQTSEFPNDNSMLKNRNLINLEPSAVQISELSKKNVSLTNPKPLDDESFELKNSQTTNFPRLSSLKANNSMRVDEYLRIEKLENRPMKGWQIIPNKASMEKSKIYQRQTSNFPNDNSILKDKNLINLESSAVQYSELSKKDVSLTNPKSPDEKSFKPENSRKSVFPKSSSLKANNSMKVDEYLRIEKLENRPMKGWQIIPNEASMEISDTYQKQISEFPNDNSIVKDRNLINLEPSAVQMSKFSKKDVSLTNPKSPDEKSFKPENSRKSVFPKSSSLKADNSMYVDEYFRIEKLEDKPMKGWQIIPNEASMEKSNIYQSQTLELPNDNSILKDKNLINLDSSAVQMSKFSKKDVSSTNPKPLDDKSFELENRQKTNFPKLSSFRDDNSLKVDENLKIGKLEIKSMKGWKITLNEASIVKSDVLPRQTYLEAESSNENILDRKNSLSISKPFKPLFSNNSSAVAEELKSDSKIENKSKKGLGLFFNEKMNSSDDEMYSKMEESLNESNNNLGTMNADLNIQLQKLLNHPKNIYLKSNEKIIPKLTFNQPGCSYGSEKSTSKMTSIASLSKFKIGIETQENLTKIKKPAKTIFSLTKNQSEKYRASTDSTNFSESKEQISNYDEEQLPKMCDLICDLIQEPLMDEPILKTVRAIVQEKGILSSKDGLWQLNGSIFDGTANLKVDFSSEFMDSILGFTALEFSATKKRMKNDPKLQEGMRRKLREGQQKLEETNWLMQLKLIKNKIPLVIKASEITQEHKEVCEKRLRILK